MAHILLGWEFGANRGHVAPLVRLAAALREAGHRVSFAVQRLDVLLAEGVGEAEVWQAPVSPRLLAQAAVEIARAPAGMADILARLGFDEAGIVAASLRGWAQLLAAARPDLVIADFAPFLLLAARDRIPAIAIGSGFATPPGDLPAFPALIEGPKGVDQDNLLGEVNRGLAMAGEARIEALPQVFAAARALPATFAELDPYANGRRHAPASPLPPGFAAAAGEGDELFVYADPRIAADSPLWKGLAAAALPVRVHVPRAPAALRSALAGHGFTVEAEAVPFARIAARSRLVLSHGGHGFTCAALAAGLPHVIFYYDLEKLLNALALARLGLGGHVALTSLEPRAFAQSLDQVYRDPAMAARARAAAPGFLARGQRSLEDEVTEAVAALC